MQNTHVISKICIVYVQVNEELRILGGLMYAASHYKYISQMKHIP